MAQPKITQVEIDALALVQIVKHCSESMPDIVTGQLFGLDINGTLGITRSFPFASTSADAASTDANVQDQMELLRVMRDVNMDHYVVGWYQSAPLDNFFTEDAIEAQFGFQETMTNSVVVVFDPEKVSQGILSVRAYRLSDEFLTLYREGNFTLAAFTKSKVSFSNIFEEIPIKLHATKLTKALLLELRSTARSSDLQLDFDALGLGTSSLLEKTTSGLIECLDGVAMEQQKNVNYEKAVLRQRQNEAAWLQRRRAENIQRRRDGMEPLSEDPASFSKPIPEPSRLESLVLTRQIDEYCQEISSLSAQALTKLYLLDSFQKDRK